MNHKARVKKLELKNIKEDFEVVINIVDEFPDAQEQKRLREKGTLILVDIDPEVEEFLK